MASTEKTVEEGNVLPGSFLSTEEEFVAGKNAFEDEDGNVYSAVIGRPEFDSREKEVNVIKPGREALKLSTGAIITGRVALVKESAVVIRLLSAEKNGKKLVFGQRDAVIPVAKSSNNYVKDLKELFRIGDYVKAKIVKLTTYSIDLATDYPEFGVIKAFCINCRSPLHLSERKLKCNVCGLTQNRKISSDYLLT